MIDSLLDLIAQSPVSSFIAEDAKAFPAIELVHVLSVVTLLGTVLMVDLRMLGLMLRGYPAGALGRLLLPITWLAFCGAALTGALLFSSNPHGYAGNAAFRAKLVLLALAGLNMAFFHLVGQRGRDFDRGGAMPLAARTAAALSALIWLAVIACGRWIGFTMAPF